MWLEIDDGIIVGLHSDACDNDNQWVEYQGKKPVKLGDQWINGKIVSLKEAIDNETLRRQKARSKIISHYPEWKQLNILREGNPKTIETMGRFVDACRDWSNDPNSDPSAIDRIKP